MRRSAFRQCVHQCEAHGDALYTACLLAIGDRRSAAALARSAACTALRRALAQGITEPSPVDLCSAAWMVLAPALSLEELPVKPVTPAVFERAEAEIVAHMHAGLPRECIDAVLADMPDFPRTCVALYALFNCSPDELAHAIGCDAAVVRGVCAEAFVAFRHHAA